MKQTIEERKEAARKWFIDHCELTDCDIDVNPHVNTILQLLKPRNEWPTSHKFKRWDRVRLSAEGKKALGLTRAASRRPDEEYGTVVTKPRYNDGVTVRVDGYKFYSVYHIDYWEKVQ